MGKIKYLAQVRDFCHKTPVVSLSSLKKMIGKNKKYVYPMLNNLVKRGELQRITKGMYSLFDDPVLIVFCLKPAYLGLQEALSIHGLWEQETNVVLLTTKIVREGVRAVFGANVLIKRLPFAYFFGFEYKQYGDWYIPVSDIEKTFIDMIYFQQPVDKVVLKQFKKKIDLTKLRMYLQRYPKEIKKKVLFVLQK